MNNKSQVIVNICNALESENADLASHILLRDAPINKSYKLPKTTTAKRKALTETPTLKQRTKREYTKPELINLFIRDGFIDRYTGERLIFTGTLRLLSRIFPNEFPYHANWKIGACHHWYWELIPTLDHIIAVKNGGVDQEINWVTTSMANNLFKSNIPLEELGWKFLPPGNFSEWDGLTRWFLEYLERKPEILKQKPSIKEWHKIAKEGLAINGLNKKAI